MIMNRWKNVNNNERLEYLSQERLDHVLTVFSF